MRAERVSDDRLMTAPFPTLPVDQTELAIELRDAVDAAIAYVPSEADNAAPREPALLAGERIALSETAPRLLALVGFPRAGKDVVAAYLQQRYCGVRRLAYSTPIIAEVNAFLLPYGHRIAEQNKSAPPYRRLLQLWGKARRIERRDYWIVSLAKTIDTALVTERLVVISGARYDSDLEPIRDRSGAIWRITRPDNPYDGGDLEAAIASLPADRELINRSEGDLRPLLDAVDHALAAPPQAGETIRSAPAP